MQVFVGALYVRSMDGSLTPFLDPFRIKNREHFFIFLFKKIDGFKS